MFDIGFSEMIVIGVVALLVIGPEKLPRVARTIGALMGRAQRYVNDVKADINREIELDELKKLRTTVLQVRETVEVRAPGNFKVAWRTNTRGKALQWWANKLDDPRLAQALMQQSPQLPESFE